MPNAAATLGLEFIDFDTETSTIDLPFTPAEAVTNPAGNVLGAFVAAILYVLERLPAAQQGQRRDHHGCGS